MKQYKQTTLVVASLLLFSACDASTGVTENTPVSQKQAVQEQVAPIQEAVTQTNTPEVEAKQAEGASTDIVPTDKTSTQPEIVMYKSPSCDCCGSWADHLRQSGFTVIEKKSDNMNAIKAEYGVPEKLSSCHTALIDGYIIEGHVPAEDVARLLKERPNVAGLTAPGMPMKSPGMQAVGQKTQGYDVLSFTKDGKTSLFKHY